MGTYVVAVKRGKRTSVPDNWIQLVRDTPGVSLCGEPASSVRVQVQATPEAASEISKAMGEFCYVEPYMEYHRLDSE